MLLSNLFPFLASKSLNNLDYCVMISIVAEALAARRMFINASRFCHYPPPSYKS
jgi:hypothetical protein